MGAGSARAFVRTLPYTVETVSHTERWGDKLVFRGGEQTAGGKMFAQIDFEKDGRAILSFATGPERFRELRDAAKALYLCSQHSYSPVSQCGI
jgi:hypothetical protein